jgi:hypothetical protein
MKGISAKTVGNVGQIRFTFSRNFETFERRGLRKMQTVALAFCEKLAGGIRTSCKADLLNRPLQGRIFGNESCAMDKVGWEAIGWNLTFPFPIGPD